MGRRSERDLRIEAVRRRLAGESPDSIANSMDRSRRWVSKWVARHDPADSSWADGGKPGRAVNRTDPSIEAQVVAVRKRLAENPWAQIGSDAIGWELRKLGTQPPPTRTIERILNRSGLITKGRGCERPKSRRLPYPAPRAEEAGDLHQADLVGPRHLDGGLGAGPAGAGIDRRPRGRAPSCSSRLKSR